MQFSKLIFSLSLAFSLSISNIQAQCATINQNATLTSSSCAAGVTPCTVCPGNTITLSGSGTNFTAGSCINWYYSTTPGFNPNAGQGTLMGCSPIVAPTITPCASCPVLSAIFADACGTEADNEFMIMLSGSGFVTDQLSVDFNNANNTGAGNSDIGSGCSWQTPTAAVISSIQTICPSANIIAAGPGVTIPANQIVFVFTSSNFSFAYNWASLCPLAPTIYVMQNGCARTTEAFTNGPGTGSNLTVTSLSCGSCSSNINYNVASLSGNTNGDFIVKLPIFGLQYLNGGCGLPPVSFPPTSAPPPSTFSLNYVIPPGLCNGGPFYVAAAPSVTGPGCPQVQTNQLSFNVVCPQATLNTATVCSSAGLNLNTLITNGPIAGTWSGIGVSGNNLSAGGAPGPRTVTFTPTSTCGTPSSTTVTVNASPTATLAAIAPVCSGQNANVSISFTGTAPFTFNLTINGSVFNAYTTSNNPFNVAVPIASTGPVQVTNLNDATCMGANSNTINASVLNPTSATLGPNGPTSVCGSGGTSLNVTFAGGVPPYTFTYAANGVNQTPLTAATNPYVLNVSPSVNTTYTLVSVSTSGCTGTATGSVPITVGGNVTGAITSGSNSICQGQSVTLNYTFTGTPPFTIVPSVNGVSQSAVVVNATTFSQTVSPPVGIFTYELQTVSSGNCSATGTGFYDLSVSATPTATLSGSGTSCTPGSSVPIDVVFTGTGPFTLNYTANGVRNRQSLRGL